MGQIPNCNTQITNNIEITKSNDQNITITYWMSCAILSVLNFGYWYLFEICFLVLGIFMIFLSE